IPMTFLTLAAIPSSLLGELVVRESIALTVIGVVSEAHIEIVSAAFALWVINLAIPALIGSFFIFGIRIFRKILHHL
ncbi:MAG: hypothetical protein AAGB22_13785, partial [Bacteroidota bacterium]